MREGENLGRKQNLGKKVTQAMKATYTIDAESEAAEQGNKSRRVSARASADAQPAQERPGSERRGHRSQQEYYRTGNGAALELSSPIQSCTLLFTDEILNITLT